MRTAVLLLLLLSVCAAVETPMKIFEQRDFGPGYEEQFDDLYVTMDCDSEIIHIYVSDEDKPVTGAVVRVLYIDYSTPLIASGPTDSDGKLSFKIIGEEDFMTGLFLTVVEKEGYNNKEAHFDISICIAEEEIPEEVIEEEIIEEEVIEEEIIEEEPEPEPEPETEPEPEEIPEPEENITNATETNITGNETGEPEAEPVYVCVSSFILIFALIPLVLYR